jgi:hypothetical protein
VSTVAYLQKIPAEMAMHTAHTLAQANYCQPIKYSSCESGDEQCTTMVALQSVMQQSRSCAHTHMSTTTHPPQTLHTHAATDELVRIDQQLSPQRRVQLQYPSSAEICVHAKPVVESVTKNVQGCSSEHISVTTVFGRKQEDKMAERTCRQANTCAPAKLNTCQSGVSSVDSWMAMSKDVHAKDEVAMTVCQAQSHAPVQLRTLAATERSQQVDVVLTKATPSMDMPSVCVKAKPVHVSLEKTMPSSTHEHMNMTTVFDRSPERQGVERTFRQANTNSPAVLRTCQTESTTIDSWMAMTKETNTKEDTSLTRRQAQSHAPVHLHTHASTDLSVVANSTLQRWWRLIGLYDNSKHCLFACQAISIITD